MLKFISVLVAFAPATFADVINESLYQFQLVSFTIQASAPAKSVTCSQDEVKQGAQDLFSFSASKDNSKRDLVPSDQPLFNDASWLIDNTVCRDLAPYLNGFGFASFDGKTGKAKVYLTAFNRQDPSPEDQVSARNNPVTRMRLDLQPSFVEINYSSYPAQCAFSQASLGTGLFGVTDELNCVLDGGLGTVKLRALKKN